MLARPPFTGAGNADTRFFGPLPFYELCNTSRRASTPRELLVLARVEPKPLSHGEHAFDR